jgi:transposase-like protein
VAVQKPRAKKDGKDLHLESYQALQGFDLLCEGVMQHMLSGVSSRNYERLIDKIEGGLGLSRSSVSRAFVKGSEEALDSINGRDLSGQSWFTIYIDGISFSRRTIVVAMGITEEGHKQLLGLREGDTEHWEICKDLLASLHERGLTSDERHLFVIDGSKALRKAVESVYTGAYVQRCIIHKERNILSYLPARHEFEFRRRWKRLHGMHTFVDAKEEYRKLLDWLSKINHQAKYSLEEAQEETLTVIRLKAPEKLRKTLQSTNAIESIFSSVRASSLRVTNWTSGKNQMVRWTAALLLEAENHLKRIPGYKEIPYFLSQLRNFSLNNQKCVA